MLSDEKVFLKKHNIDEAAYNQTSLRWEQLNVIYDAYTNEFPQFRTLENYFSECLRSIENVHSVKTRLKDPENVLETIIRKKISNKDLEINHKNYKEVITDLLLIGVLHLFKDDWEPIHEYITNKWALREKPIVYVREEDDKTLFKRFEEKGCSIQLHQYGYRSINYLALSGLDNKTNYIEIQVRTIFEEGWSEIDHAIRRSLDIDNPILSQYLLQFKKITGMADEMGLFLQKHMKEEQKKNNSISRSKNRIEVSELKSEETEKISSNLKNTKITEKEYILPSVDHSREIQQHEILMHESNTPEKQEAIVDAKDGDHPGIHLLIQDIQKNNYPKTPPEVPDSRKDNYPKVQEGVLNALKDEYPKEQGDAQKFTLSKLRQAIQGIAPKNVNHNSHQPKKQQPKAESDANHE